MIYASVDELNEVSDRSFKLGRLVAVSEFTKALIRYGHFDEYRFYCANLQTLKAAKARLEPAFSEKELDRVLLSLIPNLVSDLEVVEFSAMHNAGGWTALSSLASIRNQFASKPFPVTSLIHSLNEPHAYLKALKISISNTQPYDAVICSSEAGRKAVRSFFAAIEENLKGLLQTRFSGEIAKIPLAVDTENFKPLDRAQCRKKLGLEPDATILLHLGRISAHDKSDPAPLFYAFRNLCNERPKLKLRLLLAGGADPGNIKFFQEICQELKIQDRVIFKPNFEDEEKPLLLGAADVFVSLVDSLQETFGISVVEAMASGRVPLISDFDGYKELVENGKSGWTVPTYWGPADGFIRGISPVINSKIHQLFLAQSIVIDMGALLKALLQAVDNPQKRAEMEKSARQRTVDHFSWKVVIGQYESLWKELGAKAAKASPEANPKPDPLAVDFYRSFSHYPTQLVDGKWNVTLTTFGKSAIQDGNFPAIYNDVGSLISTEWLKIILGNLVKTPKTVQQLIAFTQQKFNSPDEHVLYHILWLAKYDIVALSPA